MATTKPLGDYTEIRRTATVTNLKLEGGGRGLPIITLDLRPGTANDPYDQQFDIYVPREQVPGLGEIYDVTITRRGALQHG